MGREKPFVTALHDKVLLCEELPIVFVHKSTLISFNPCSSVINRRLTFYVFGFLFVQKANTVFVVLGSNNI